MVEFVSANPTGPLHVGHGRLAAYGATLANLLDAVGFDVAREYYINDAGRQMEILAASIWLRYLELLRRNVRVPRPTATAATTCDRWRERSAATRGPGARATGRRGLRGPATRCT